MKYKNTTTYIINSKGYPGGISRKEYTWKEVLEFFNVEEPIDSIKDLKEYLMQRDGDNDYIIEKWQEYDENGFIK